MEKTAKKNNESRKKPIAVASDLNKTFTFFLFSVASSNKTSVRLQTNQHFVGEFPHFHEVQPLEKTGLPRGRCGAGLSPCRPPAIERCVSSFFGASKRMEEVKLIDSYEQNMCIIIILCT